MDLPDPVLNQNGTGSSGAIRCGCGFQSSCCWFPLSRLLSNIFSPLRLVGITSYAVIVGLTQSAAVRSIRLTWVVVFNGKNQMKTPKEKYMNDPEYNHLVKMLENLIAQAHFTPSELREACVLASINYEMRNIRHSTISTIHPKLEDALRTLDEFVSSGRPRR